MILILLLPVETQAVVADLNVFPILSPDDQGGTTKSTVALAGVFYNAGVDRQLKLVPMVFQQPKPTTEPDVLSRP